MILSPRQVLFVVQCAGDAATLASVGALAASLSRHDWFAWKPALHLCFESRAEPEMIRHFAPALAPYSGELPEWLSVSCETGTDKVPLGVDLDQIDVLVRLSATSLLVGSVEYILDRVADTQCVASPLGATPALGTSSAEALGFPVPFEHVYPADSDIPAGKIVTGPFFPSASLLFVPAPWHERLMRAFVDIRAGLAHLFGPEHAAEAAMAIAITRLPLDHWALSANVQLRLSAHCGASLHLSDACLVDFAGCAGTESGLSLPDVPARPSGVMHRFTRAHVDNFERTQRRSPGALMRIKQQLVAQFGLQAGFEMFLETVPLPGIERLQCKAITSQRDYSEHLGLAFHLTDRGGMPFSVDPLPVFGRPDLAPVHGLSRSLYVACVEDATVRGHSSFIELAEAVLFDFEGEEFARFDSELEFDQAVFHADESSAWILQSGVDAEVRRIDEAFSLLSARSHAFGHWVWENLMKLAAAGRHLELSAIPVLIDAGMHASHRQSLEWLLPPGAEIIEIGRYETVRVSRLWVAPTPHFMTVFEKRNPRFKWEYLLQPPARAARLVDALNESADAVVGAQEAGTGRLYLARRVNAFSHKVLVNREDVENRVRARGFKVVYPEDLDLPAQLQLVRDAAYVIAPEGSAMFLMCFANPGTRLCVLNDPRTEGSEIYNTLFGASRVQAVLLTGPIVAEHDQYYEWADYAIESATLESFLDSWLSPNG